MNTDSMNSLPYFMRGQVLSFLCLKEISLVAPTCKYFHKELYKVLNNQLIPLRVPEDVSTIPKAIALIGPTYIDCGPNDLSIGTPVRARYKTNGGFYSGIISRVHEAQSSVYDVDFTDGDKREAVPLKQIQILSKPKNNIIKNKINTIVLNKGTHVVEQSPIKPGKNYVDINMPINIVGNKKVKSEDILVRGGIWISESIPKNVHIEHMKITHACGSGIVSYSNFTVKDVIVEQCTGHGISSGGKDHIVGKCINVDVKECTGCGISTHLNSTIEMSGTDTKVHNNCTKSYTLEYGRECYGADCFIKLIHPLTKEKVAFCNSKITYSGERNYGCRKGGSVEKQIVTIFPEK